MKRVKEKVKLFWFLKTIYLIWIGGGQMVQCFLKKYHKFQCRQNFPQVEYPLFRNAIPPFPHSPPCQNRLKKKNTSSSARVFLLENVTY